MIIIATVEKYSFTEERLKKLVLAGADVLRFNFSYRTIDENIKCIIEAQQVMEELNSSAKILIDFPINKIRLGDFDLKLFPVNENDDLVFKSSAYSFDCYEYVPVQTANLGEKLRLGQSITIGDGEVSAQVTEIINHESVRVKIQNKGIIQYMKTLNIKQEINEEEITKQYTNIVKKIGRINANYIAVSYFNAKLFKDFLNIVKNEKLNIKIILKIENEMNEEELEKICQDNNFSSILIDRGEIGVNMPYYKMGVYQKQIINIAKKYKKSIIISTQILESTMQNYIPNRAEIIDLTNSVLEGVNGIMLCRETVISSRPAYAISVAKKIIAEVEKYKDQK